ncbi:MAG: 30S ribosomal protein S12 methylthiotransferase RimO [Candidatus Cloacimonetes bacterium]|nr:30S ribosomal protein S12 methylthiotransferase RimO [Candidatus Cloacimonadota bacterium]
MPDNQTKSPLPSIYVHTVGCAKNLVDSEMLLGLMKGKARLVESGEDASLIVVNTCGFIDEAKTESIDAVMEAVQLKADDPARRVYVMGCLSQRYREQIQSEIPELDGVYGIGEFKAILRDTGLDGSTPLPAELEIFERRELLSPGHSAYLRISDGCNQHCTYCSIPSMRGRMVSRPLDDVVHEAFSLARRGVQELNVIAQEISSYGEDLGANRICELLRRLNDVPVPWIRLLYSHPPKVDRAFGETIAACDRILPWLDFPVEHVSGEMLKKMARRGDAASLKATMRMLRELNPGMVIRTSIIVGFPGEQERHVQELLEFMEDCPFDRLGVFCYSPEENTPSVNWPDQVPRELAEERKARVMEKQMELSLAANQALVGSVERILIDEVDPASGISEGRTWRDALEIDNTVELRGVRQPGTFVDCRIVDASEYDLIAELLPTEGKGARG